MNYSLEYLCDGKPWAITEPSFSTMFRIAAEREADIRLITSSDALISKLEAIGQKQGPFVDGTENRVEQHGGVAVMDVKGPLFRYANLFTKVSGATSVEMLGRDLSTALADPRVSSVLLNVNSTGGEADGISELAQKIRNSPKPVWSYVSGWAASGGYWLASAAHRMIVHESAMVGSIGVIATITDDSKRRERDGYTRYEIVSSQSPLKKVDPATDEGASTLKGMVDRMATHFIAKVAEYRGTTAENVTENYGRGFVLDAERAIAAGMADGAGTFDDTVAQLNGGFGVTTTTKVIGIAAGADLPVIEAKEDSMAEEKQPDVAELRVQAATAEQARIKAILECEESKGRESLARHIAFNSRMEVDEARSFMAAAPKMTVAADEKKPDQFAEYMKTLGNPKVGTGADEPDEVGDEVRRISAFLPAHQRRAS